MITLQEFGKNDLKFLDVIQYEAFVDGKKMSDAQWSATIVDRK